MKIDVLVMLLTQILNLLSPEILRNAVNSGLDFIEKKVADSPNTYDDAIIKPVVKLIRMTLGIIDQDPQMYPEVNNVGGFNKSTILETLLNSLLCAVPPEITKGFIDSGLDIIENYIATSKTKMDDMIVLPLIAMIRVSFNIPDNDYVVGTLEQK